MGQSSSSSIEKQFPNLGIDLPNDLLNRQIEEIQFAMEDIDNTIGLAQHAMIIAIICDSNGRKQYVRIEAHQNKETKQFTIEISLIPDDPELKKLKIGQNLRQKYFKKINISQFNKKLKHVMQFSEQNWVGTYYNLQDNNCFHFAKQVSTLLTDNSSKCQWFSQNINDAFQHTELKVKVAVASGLSVAGGTTIYTVMEVHKYLKQKQQEQYMNSKSRKKRFKQNQKQQQYQEDDDTFYFERDQNNYKQESKNQQQKSSSNFFKNPFEDSIKSLERERQQQQLKETKNMMDGMMNSFNAQKNLEATLISGRISYEQNHSSQPQFQPNFNFGGYSSFTPPQPSFTPNFSMRF